MKTLPRNVRNYVTATVLRNWVHTLRETPDRALKVNGIVLPYSLLTTSTLLRAFEAFHGKRISRMSLVHELGRAGFRKVHMGEPIRTQTHGPQRLWAVRDRDKLRRIEWPEELANIYDEERNAFVSQLSDGRKTTHAVTRN